MEEIWKDVPNYENMYQVSSLGRVRSINRYITNKNGFKYYIKGKILSPNVNNSGYYYLSLNKKNKHWYAKVHRLVAMAFIPNPNNFAEVNHKDGNKLNNKIENLEWVSHSLNHVHAYKHGMTNLIAEHKKRERSVLQIDINTNIVIKVWNSISEAERYFNRKSRSNISNCLHGWHKTAYGFKWKFNV